MPYELVQTSPDSVNVTKNLESFWFFCNFNVDKAAKMINIEDGYFATYISQKSGKPYIEKLSKESNGKKEDADRKLQISNVASHKISINNAKLVDSRCSQFSNEVSQLHLFKLSKQDEHKKEWIDSQGWTAKFTNPTTNDDGKYFIKQTLNFGEVTDRYVYWLVNKTNHNGTDKFVVATPFVANSLIGTILSLHKKNLPKIQISADEKSWPYPPGGEDLPGEIKGYLMVAEGAFKSIALSAEMDTLIDKIASTGTSEEILTYLSEVVQSYPTRIQRTLETVSVTHSNAIVPSNPQLPIEVLYMKGLNSSGEIYVPPII